MKLIRKLGTKISKTGRKHSWGEFLCSFCNKIVEKKLEHGLRDKSCGCVRYTLSSKKLKGKKRQPFTEEHRQNIKKGKLGKKQTKEHRQKISNALVGKYIGELASNWQGGIDNNSYGIAFNKQIKYKILERDDYTCQNPNCERKTDLLDIHHIDYDKQNNKIDNFITLCRSCHSKINSKNNRYYWITYYQNIIINRIVECLL